MGITEYSFIFKRLQGMRVDDMHRHNIENTELLVNARVTPVGLQAIGPPKPIRKMPEVPGQGSERWPFPQLMETGRKTFLLGRSTIYEVLRSGTVSIKAHNITNVNYPWSAGTFGDRIIFGNGITRLMFSTNNVLTAFSSNNAAKPFPDALAYASSNGRLIAGAVWAYGGFQPGWVMWSRPGTVDMKLENQGGVDGGPISSSDPDEPTSNGAGVLQMDAPGRVMAIRHLDGVGPTIYLDGSVVQMMDIGHPYIYGQRVLTKKTGIASPLAVDGDASEHYWLDRHGSLWRTSSEGISRIGHRETIGQMYRYCPVVCMHKERGEVYIGY